MKNLGKTFERNWRLSIPQSENIFYYRLKDTASSYYGGNDKLRFSQNNMADAILYHCNNLSNNLLILEYKSHKGKSLPINCIRSNQLQEMLQANEKTGVIPMLVVFFSDIERCFSLNIKYVEDFLRNSDRKSIPLEYFEENGVEIEVIKLRTNYKYNIEKWLKEY